MPNIKILSASSSRADIGIMEPVWQSLCSINEMDLHILLTGMHLRNGGADRQTFPSRATLHSAGSDIGGGAGSTAADGMGSICSETGQLLKKLSPDLLFVIGDRLDMLPVAMASLPFNLPIVHLHGGEVSEGAVDDRVRHAMTKLAHVHCVSCQAAQDRVIALGEEAWRVHLTGAPGLDTLRMAPHLSLPEFRSAIGLRGNEPFRLVTIHPETNAQNLVEVAEVVLQALAKRPAQTLFTAPNSDPGGNAIRSRILSFIEEHDWAIFRESLGSRLYPAALRHAAMMIGNSSSGIIEAGFFGLPVINVGDRQKGRDRGNNVKDVANDPDQIVDAIDALATSSGRSSRVSIYGDGHAAPKIVNLLRHLPDRSKLLRKTIHRQVSCKTHSEGSVS